MDQKQKSMLLIGAVILLVVIGAVALASRGNNAPEEVTENETRTEQIITARALFDDGTYTIAGEFQVPTTCHDVEAVADVSNAGESAVINFTVEAPGVEEVCAQVVSEKEFRVTFNANEDAEIRAAVGDNTPVTLNLIPVETEDELGNADIKG